MYSTSLFIGNIFYFHKAFEGILPFAQKKVELLSPILKLCCCCCILNFMNTNLQEMFYDWQSAQLYVSQCYVNTVEIATVLHIKQQLESRVMDESAKSETHSFVIMQTNLVTSFIFCCAFGYLQDCKCLKFCTLQIS